MKFAYLAMLAGLPLAACNSNQIDPFAATVPRPAASVPSVSSQDQSFTTQAAQSDQFELQSSQLALQKSHSRSVRAFAQQMLDDHSTTSQQLMAAAQQKGIVLPDASALDPVLQQKLSVLQAANRTFDREYIADQVSNHRATAQVMQTELSSGQDADLKTLAANTLPLVQSHLAAAERLRAR